MKVELDSERVLRVGNFLSNGIYKSACSGGRKGSIIINIDKESSGLADQVE